LSTDLSVQVEKWVKKQLEKEKFYNVRDDKVIEDAVVGPCTLEKHETNVLDLPLLQRLRKISQTGFAYLLFPCATHTRFEHTLGVVTMANRFCEAVKKHEPKMIKEEHQRDVRLAALLHDVGHGPFSHVSESFFSSYNEVRQQFEKQTFSKCRPKPHEMLSYFVVTSPTFKNFLEENLKDKKYRVATPDLKKVGNLIVGMTDDPWEAYLSDIINGAFDSDKFDYILRDCYFTGIRMTVDVSRIFHTVSIDTKKTFNRQGLVVDVSGSIFIEQILFNKMLLFSSLYHHHKERAAECMLKSIYEATRDKKLKINGFDLNKVTDFLNLTDVDLLTTNGKPEDLIPLIRNLSQRNLLKRALVISRRTIKTNPSLSKEKREKQAEVAYRKLLNVGKDYAQVRQLRELIVDEIGGVCTVYEVWLDIPEPPSFREAKQAVIRVSEEERIRLDKIFPVSKWLETYAENKWRGHVFCPPDTKMRKQIAEAARKVIKKALDVEFDENAILYAKIE
jgi:HD superfamily phosphohydrolase